MGDINVINIQLISLVVLLFMPQLISSRDGFLGFMLRPPSNNETKNLQNNETADKLEIPGIGVLGKVSNTAQKVGGFITHQGHYDDGTIEENVEYNTSDAKPSFDFPATQVLMKVGRALHLIPEKKETDGLDTNTTFFNGVVSKFKTQLKAIYPGTQWCGDGDRARNFDDLGRFKSTDKCCRSHDICPVSIAPKKMKFELENTGLFTRSHCDCDDEFYHCLKNSSSLVSKKIGITYFTILGPQCFKEEFPIIGCVLYNKGKCVQYHLNNTEEKRYQWFDNPPFN